MLTRSSQVGEFYVMRPPQNVPPKGTIGCCDIIIYDEEADRHVRIKWEDALKATLANDTGVLKPADGTKDAQWLKAAEAWSNVNRGKKREATPENDVTAENENDVAAAFTYASEQGRVYIVVARPFIEHLMHSAVVAVAGRDTGATLFGPAGAFLPRAATLHTRPCRAV